VPNLLTDLVIDRVDLVDDGANSEAFIKLYKRKESHSMNFEEILKELKEEHVEAIKAEITKACDAASAEVKEQMTSKEKELEDAKTELAKANEELAKANEEINKSKEDNTSNEDVIKNLDPAVQELFKSITAQKEAAEKVAKQLGEQKIEEEAIAKAKELKALPADEKVLVSIVKSASTEVYELLKSVSKLIEDGEVLKEKGNASTDGNQDAWAKIEKAADVIVDAEKVTKQAAISKVIKEQPELYREYLKGGI
jgi:chromosome segregation ATPase